VCGPEAGSGGQAEGTLHERTIERRYGEAKETSKASTPRPRGCGWVGGDGPA
jgi:hypothetical protein